MFFILLLAHAVKRTFHFKPEDMYKTMTGLTRRKQRSLHGPRRAKSTNKKIARVKKICGPANRREATSILCQFSTVQ